MKPRNTRNTRMGIGAGLILAAAVLVAGCANFASGVRKAEYASAQLADGTIKGYATWWKDATNRPAYYHLTTEQLWQQRSNVVALARKVGASMATLDSTMTVYETNAASKPMVSAALTTFLTEVGNVSTLVNDITGKGQFTPITP